MKKIAIIGTGTVGQTFASKLISLGYDVMMGTRNVSENWLAPQKTDTVTHLKANGTHRIKM
jgi:predicted dinucleotide-binding enzyme